VPSTYLWTGAGASINWDDASNWSPAAGATGTYPGSGGSTGDVAQLVDVVPGGIRQPAPRLDGAFALAEIDFGSAYTITILGDGNASHTLTVSGAIVSSDTIAANTNSDEIVAPVSAGNGVLITNSAPSAPLLQLDNLTLAANALITLTGSNDIQIETLDAGGNSTLINQTPYPLRLGSSVTLGAGGLTLKTNATITGTVSGPGGLTVAGGSMVTLTGANTYTGPTVIASGATVHALSTTALGNSSSPVTVNGILDVSPIVGLPGTYYSWAGATAQGTVALSGGGVAAVAVTGPGNTGGKGYLAPPLVTFTNASGDTTGTGAAAHAVLGPGGVVTSVVIDNPGSNYTLPPTVSFTVNNDGAANLAALAHGTFTTNYPRAVLGNPPIGTLPNSTTSLAALSAYAADLPVLATDSSASDNGQNNLGSLFSYGISGAGFPGPLGSGATSFLAIWSGYFYAPVTGMYDFSTASDDGSAVWIDGAQVVDNNNDQSLTFRDSNTPVLAGTTTAPTLTAGTHAITIEYYQLTGGYGFSAGVNGPPASGLAGALLNAVLSPSPYFNLQVAGLTGAGTVNTGGISGNLTLQSASSFVGNILGQGTITVQSGPITLLTAETFTGTWVLNGTSSLTLGSTASPISGESMSRIINNTSNNVVINNPTGNAFTLNASILSTTAGLTLIGNGTYNLGGASTFTRAISIPANTVINGQGTSPLGQGDITLPASSTLNVSGNTFGTGLPVTWYAWGGTSPRLGAGGNPPAANLSIHSNILDYAASQGVINTGIPFETSAAPNITNVGGSILEYGGNSGRNTPGGTGNGFPAAVLNNNNNGSSIMGIWQGLFLAQTTGVYDFATGSDDGSLIYVDGNLVVDNSNDQGYTIRDSNNPFDTGATTAPTLTAGVHTILIEFYNGGGGYNFDAFVNGSPLSNSLLGVPVINLSVGSLTGNGTVNLGANGITIGGDGNNTTFTGTINGTPTSTGVPNLTKAGTGTLIIPNPASLNITGSMAISGGTLQIGNGTATLGALTASSILDNGTLVLNGPNGGSLIYNGNITGSGGLTQKGVWTLTLGGNSSYGGATVIQAGSTVNATSGTALGNGDLNLLAGSTLNVTSPGTPNLGSGLPGHYYSIAGDALPDGRMNSVTGILSMIAQYGGGTTANPFGYPIATDTSAFNTSNTQGQANTNNNGATFNYGTGSTAAINTSGFPKLAQTTNSGGNSFFGVWTGIFFAAVSGTYVFDTASDDGSTLFVDGALVVNNNFQQGVFTRQGAVNLGAGAHAIEIAYENGGGGYGLWADVQLPGSTSFQRLPNALLGTLAPTLLNIGALSGAGTINLGVSGGINNGLVIGADNHSTSFTGTINSPGTSVANFPNLVKSGTGTFILPSGESYTGLTGISSGVLQLGTSTTAVSGLPTSGILDNGNLTIFLPINTSLTYNGVISGSGGLTINGQGDTITLGGLNTYTGPTFVGANTIKQGVAYALPTLSAFTLGAVGVGGGTIDLNNFDGSIGSVTSVFPVFGNSSLTNSGTTTVNLKLNGSGAIINVNVPITGKLNLIATGIGTEILSAANTYTGNTTITGSTVKAANPAALPSGGNLTVSGTGVLDLGGVSLTLASLQGFGTTNQITNSSALPSTLTISGSAPGSFAYTGSITGAVSIVNATSAATQTILGGGPNSTFYAGVTATSGVLAGVPGSFGTGPVTLNGGGVDLIGGQQIVGFGGNGVGWTVNKNATAAGITGEGGFGNNGSVLPATNTWQATTANNNEAADLICDTPVQPNNGFTASFTYLDNSPGNGTPADGIMFFLEADPLGPNVLGGSAGALGYGAGGTGSNTNGSIRNSMGIALNLYTGAAGGRGTAIQANGSINACIDPGMQIGPMLVSGHPINVVMQYNAAPLVLVETFTDMVTGASTFVTFYGVNLFTFLGTSNAFIGFSGSTGGLNAQQLISNFTYLGASGAATAFTNDIQASAGTTSSLLVQANSLANACSTSGNVTVPAGATVAVGPDTTSTLNQSYSLSSGGATTLAGTVNVANNGTGTGTLVFNGALQGAGTTIGSIGDNGNVVLGTGSTYKVVLGGSSAASFTHLAVSGALNLAGGNLSISYANGFSPALNQTFTILQSAGPMTGTFAQGSMIIAGNVTFMITYNANSVVLRSSYPPPVTRLTFTVAPSAATAGTPVSFTVAATDGAGNVAGGINDSVTLSSSAGPGTSSPTTVTLINGSATVPLTFTKSGLQTLTAHDTSELLTDATTSVTVSPGTFDHFKVTTLTTPGGQTAGNSFLVQVQAVDTNNNAVSTYGGPASVTVTATGSNPATSSFPQVVSIDSSGQGIALGTLTVVGSYPIVALGGAFGTPTPPTVTVVPSAAARLTFVTQPVNTATGVKLPAVSVAVQDVYGNTVTSDNTDQITLSIASSPGPGAPGFLAGSTLTAPAVYGVASFNNLTLVVPGVYSLAEVVAGKFIGPASRTFSVAPLQVVSGSLVGSPSGFNVSFNAPFLVNSTTPVIYGSGFGAMGPAPTVTLVGPSGPVEGSVILDTAHNSLTFVETDTANVYGDGLAPQLPDGAYTVAITSSAATDGLQALNSGGGFLDGTYTGSPGRDFVGHFTISAAASGADVLWIPATADGPKQPLEAPGYNLSGGGYPIYLDDATGLVTSVNVTFNYNPAMLTLDAVPVSSNPSLPGSSFILNSGASSPGHAVLTYTGPAADAAGLAGGNVPLGFINAHIPNSSTTTPIYKGKDLLTLSSISINGGGVPAVGVNAVHLVAYVGDADGNGSYSSGDAVLITRAVLQNDSGFAAYPLVDPVIVADTDGSGFIPADAAFQVSEVSNHILATTLVQPPSPPVDTTPIGNNVDPTLSLASTVSASRVTVSVNLDDAHPAGSTGLIRATLALKYDPGQFTVSAADIHAGALMVGGNWTVRSTIDPATGQIGISLACDTPIASSVASSLVTIDFHPVGQIVDPSAILLVASADPNGQWFETELQDTVGTFTVTLI
jgi:autotransporter-associated beta strand protein